MAVTDLAFDQYSGIEEEEKCNYNFFNKTTLDFSFSKILLFNCIVLFSTIVLVSKTAKKVHKKKKKTMAQSLRRKTSSNLSTLLFFKIRHCATRRESFH